MKKHYLFAAALLASAVSYGQNTQNQAPAQELAQPQQESAVNSTISEPTGRAINQLQQATIQSAQTSVNSNSSEPCATHDINTAYWESIGMLDQFNASYMQQAQNAANMTFPETPGVNEISVIFHVVHNPNNPAENVSNANIMALFQELQEDFRMLNADVVNARTGAPYNFTPVDCNINFCLATQDETGTPLAEVGVVRVSTTEDWYDKNNGETDKMKSSVTGGSDIWNRNKYMNVWICDITNGASSGVAGYAYRPSPTMLPGVGIDGIVIDYNLGMGGNVLTHEVGHYLGLDHPWGGSGGCGVDDGFTDTPVTEGPSNQPTTNDYQNSCSGSQQTCVGTETQYENYMDYANCTVMFTQEQANYMLSILQGIRGSLLLSPGCDPTNTPPNSAFVSFPTGPAPVIIPQNASVSFYDQSTNVPTGWAWTISGTQGVDWQWINGTNQNSQDPVAEFYTVGTYDVTLAASNIYGTDATPASEPMYVQVAAGATGIGCDTLRNWDPNQTTQTGSIPWAAPSAGYVNGHALIGTDNAFIWAQRFTSPTTTDIRAIEYAPGIVNDGGGEVIWRIYTDGGTQPGTLLESDTVQLADINAGFWNQIEVNPPVTGITGNFWVGFEITYTNPLDTFVLISNITSAAANTDYWYDGTAWESIATTTGGGAGTHSFVDILTSTGPAPNMTFTATSDSICVGGDILVDGSGSTNNIDYRWYVTDEPWTTSLETSNSSSNTFNFPYAPGSYNIYLFGSGSCLNDGVYMPVEVLPSVSATVTPTATTCGNNNGTITVTAEAGGDGTYYYSLDGVNYQIGNTFTNLAPGDYDVYIATFGDNCEAMYTVNVASSSPASASASAGQAVCLGASATITATGGGTYQWFDGSTPLGASASISVTPSTYTQYTCIVTDGGGCQATVYTNVDVNIPIEPTISASASTTICSGSTVDLTSSSPTGNVWSTTETSSTITVSTAGPFTVTAPDINGCSATSQPFAITVIPTPTIAGNASDPTACGTTTGSIQVTGSGTGDVSWSGTATSNANGVTLPYTINGLAAGAYNITFTDGNGCTSNLLAQALNDPNPPTQPTITAGGPITFCDGGSVVLTSSYGTGNAWSTTESTSSITVTTTETISVTYTDGSGCSSTSAPISVTVNPNPSAPTITPSGPTTFCDGGSVDLSSSQGTGNDWSTTETTQTITVTAAGPYTVTYTDGNGCSAVSSATTITVNPLPTVSLTALADVCDYSPVFTLTGGSPAGGTFSGPGVSGGDQFDPATAGLGTHTITYSYTDGNGCTNTADQSILVDPCLTINENDQFGLSIFPNPTKNELNIVFEGDFNYEILDARGRLVNNGSGSNEVVLNTTDYETGVYFVTIKNESNTVTTRVVKQ
jgi:hypothetical protein